MAKNKLSQEEIKQLVELYQKGTSVEKIAKKYKISLVTVYDYLKRNSIKPNRKQKKINMQKIMKEPNKTITIIKLYKEGTPIEEISKITNTQINTINNTIQKYKTLIQDNFPKRRKSIENIITMVELYDKKVPTKYITQQAKCSLETLYRYIKHFSKPENKKPQKITNEKEKMIIKLYKQGIPIKEIAEKVGVSTPTIYKYVHKNEKLRTSK